MAALKLVSLQLQDKFAIIRAVEQLVHRSWGVLQPFDHVKTVLNFAFAMPRGERSERLFTPIPVIQAKKAFHAGTFDHQVEKIVRTRRHRQCTTYRVIERNHATDDDARAQVEQAQHIFQNGAADIVEIEVDAVRAAFLQALVDWLGVGTFCPASSTHPTTSRQATGSESTKHQ